MKTKKINRALCQFPFADGRSCQMPKAPNHDYLCLFHADRERRLLSQQALDAELAADLFGPAGELRSSTEVNAFLTRLSKHAIAGRISPQLFHTLAYSAALVLQSLPGVRNDATTAIGLKQWEAELRRIYLSRSKPPTS